MSNINWSEYLYLVAIPNGPISQEAKRIQKILSESFDIYTNSTLPPMHITLCAIRQLQDQDFLSLTRLINEVTTPYLPLTIEADGFECFRYSHNSLVLKIRDHPTLFELQNNLKSALDEQNFLVPSTISKWIFHITLVSSLFASSPLAEEDFNRVCDRISLIDSSLMGRIHRLELWSPVPDDDKRVLGRYYLHF